MSARPGKADDADVRAERSAAINVRGRIGRGSSRNCDDLYRFSSRIKYYDCGARFGRIVGRHLIYHQKGTLQGVYLALL
jgi:hypothetical protein